MYPYTWQWSYTLLVLALLLAVFLVSCAVLLLRHSPRRWHRMEQSKVIPCYTQLWDEDTQEFYVPSDRYMQKLYAQGIERAREREYYNPRGER